jgi:hypothetical protein
MINNEQSHTKEDMATLYQLPQDPHSATQQSCALLTQLLHPAKSDMPAITLTSYNHISPTDTTSSPLLHFYKSIDSIPTDSELASSKIQAGALVQLRSDLEEHFVGLKREFEERAGRKWVPLREWETEEWEWEWDGEGSNKGYEWVIWRIAGGEGLWAGWKVTGMVERGGRC